MFEKIKWTLLYAMVLFLIASTWFGVYELLGWKIDSQCTDLIEKKCGDLLRQ